MWNKSRCVNISSKINPRVTIFLYFVSHDPFFQNMVLIFYIPIPFPFALKIKFCSQPQDKWFQILFSTTRLMVSNIVLHHKINGFRYCSPPPDKWFMFYIPPWQFEWMNEYILDFLYRDLTWHGHHLCFLSNAELFT